MSAWMCSNKHIASIVKWGWPDVGSSMQQNIADRLAAMNNASVNYRYDENVQILPVVMSEAVELQPWDVESLARSYDYQTSELLNFEETEEYKHIKELIRLAEAACPRFNRPKGRWSI